MLCFNKGLGNTYQRDCYSLADHVDASISVATAHRMAALRAVVFLAQKMALLEKSRLQNIDLLWLLSWCAFHPRGGGSICIETPMTSMVMQHENMVLINGNKANI